MRHLIAGLSALALSALLACSSAPREAAPRPESRPRPALEAAAPVDLPGLHNVVAYTPQLYSGSQPEGPGLETLAAMGFRTIISVDGAQPAVEQAEALGLRYVHLPIGYDGIDAARKLELARAARDLPGPIYVHCHHGKHRSAGAAAAITRALGQLDASTAVARMQVSGTAPDYRGLYACATDTALATPAALDAAPNAFPSRYKTTGIVQIMVDVDFALDNVKAIEKSAWSVPAEHPDLVPAAEVGRIAHYLRELEDDGEVQGQPAEFLTFLRSSREAAEQLEKSLLERAAGADLSADMKRLTSSCKACHAKFRD